MKKIIALLLTVVLAASVAIGGTVAYLQDSARNDNTMTIGTVEIKQLEKQRVQKDDGTYPTHQVEGTSYTTYELEKFEQKKMLVPTAEIDANGNPVNFGAGHYQDTVVWFEDIGSYNGMQVFTSENAVDKFVFVKNTGNTSAYVRTLIAFEIGSLSLDEADTMLRKSYHGGWTIKNQNGIEVTIGGTDYAVYEYVYQGYKDTHPGGVLPAKAMTPCSLAQVYLNSAATNDTVAALDGNENGMYDILVLSQAVQADGWTAVEGKTVAQTALDVAFGVADATNVAKWFEANTTEGE